MFPKGDFLGLLICCSQKNSDQETLKIPFVAISFKSNLRMTGLFIYVDVHLKTILALTLIYEGCARGSCVRRWSLLQDCHPVKFKDPKLMKFS